MELGFLKRWREIKIRQLVINLMTNVQVLGSVGAKRMILLPNIRKRTEPRQNGDIQDPIMRGIKNLVVRIIFLW